MSTLSSPFSCRRLPKALTPDELSALRAVPKNLRDRALIEVMAGCGLRVSEACDLTLEGVWKGVECHGGTFGYARK